MLVLLLFAALFLAVLLQSLVAAPGIGRPDLVLLLAVAWGLHRGSYEGSLAGLTGGLMLDLFSGMPFGVNAVLLGVLGLLAGLGEGSPSRSRLPLLVSTAVLGTVAFHGGSYLVLQALGWTLPGADAFARFAAPTALLNAVLLPLVFRFTRHLIRISTGWRRLEL